MLKHPAYQSLAVCVAWYSELPKAAQLVRDTTQTLHAGLNTKTLLDLLEFVFAHDGILLELI